ncbi:MAG: ParB/RepB/Spo0J family partition protein [Streptococcaceae bacterium]|nr:ParB/RepB/Spo0J family partition protein [Streptococcaceae bacterium]
MASITKLTSAFEIAEDALQQLKQSIDSTTLIEPILIRDHDSKPGYYLIVDGERRLRAYKELNITEIACRVLPIDSVAMP